MMGSSVRHSDMEYNYESGPPSFDSLACQSGRNFTLMVIRVGNLALGEGSYRYFEQNSSISSS